MKNKIRAAVAIFLVCGGLGMAFYPWISNWAHGRMVQSEVKVYEREIVAADAGETERQWNLARRYNKALAESGVALTDPFIATEKETGASLKELYEMALQMNEDGLMCFVEIPKIQVYLPVYHGASEQVLKHGAGHLQNSALPVGAFGCRPVISAHSGVSTSKMFSDLTELEEGDLFYLHVLDQIFTYRICEIQVIWPDETDLLLAQKNRDLVSLLTCTPYGVNTQRLVVTGERVKDDLPGFTEQSESGKEALIGALKSDWMKNYRRALTAGVAIVAATLIGHTMIQKRKRSRRHIFKGRDSMESGD